jgi:hypothetical protein
MTYCYRCKKEVNEENCVISEVDYGTEVSREKRFYHITCFFKSWIFKRVKEFRAWMNTNKEINEMVFGNKQFISHIGGTYPIK